MNPSEVVDTFHQLTGDQVKVINYDDIINNNLNTLFRQSNGRFVMFYPFGKLNNVLMGHYTAIIKNPKDKTIYYYDSLGFKPDEYKKLSPYRHELYDEKVNSLLKHLIKYCNKGWVIDYNDYKHQAHDPKVQTCGLHSIFRLINSDLSNDEYDDLLSKLSKKHKVKNLDKLIQKLIGFRV